jgi:hypothetical protein|tara:strand:+ start:47 stop:703 length:657 start_codon:yes stop_codon:yes gene_type:complete
MIYIEDDFLTEEQFTALKNKVESHYSPIEPRELFDNYDYHNEPDKYILPIARSGDWLDSCIPNAPQCIPALQKMQEVLIEQGVKELKNWSSWFQYSVDTMSLPPHRDQAVRKSLPKDTYTCVIYTSDWKPNWGGEFVVGSPVFNDEGLIESLNELTHSIEPKPNRMVIWSREEWHMVNALTVNDPNYVRSFFGTSWSSIESKDHDQNPFQRFYFTAET